MKNPKLKRVLVSTKVEENASFYLARSSACLPPPWEVARPDSMERKEGHRSESAPGQEAIKKYHKILIIF